MAALEAEEIERLVVAASAPHMEAGARRRLLSRLDALARPRSQRPPVAIERYDPDAAMQYFSALGVDVIRG